MSQTFFTSDWHLGHRNICKHQPQFTSEEERSNLLIRNYCGLVTKRDTCYFLGDMIFDKRYLGIMKHLPGRKILILGNHCTDNKKRPTISELAEVFTGGIHSLFKHDGVWLSHCPIHPDELRGKLNIHGHTHGHILQDSRYLNICVEHTGYGPITQKEVKELFQKQGQIIFPKLNN